jgi:hypothetical protein
MPPKGNNKTQTNIPEESSAFQKANVTRIFRDDRDATIEVSILGLKQEKLDILHYPIILP